MNSAIDWKRIISRLKLWRGGAELVVAIPEYKESESARAWLELQKCRKRDDARAAANREVHIIRIADLKQEHPTIRIEGCRVGRNDCCWQEECELRLHREIRIAATAPGRMSHGARDRLLSVCCPITRAGAIAGIRFAAIYAEAVRAVVAWIRCRATAGACREFTEITSRERRVKQRAHLAPHGTTMRAVMEPWHI